MSGDGLHDCPWPGCTQRVPRHLWGCKAHWYRLPRELRDQCSAAWRSGSMGAHMEALDAIDEWLDPFPSMPAVPNPQRAASKGAEEAS